ncbi:MAG: TetR/AcrR family transcriptional regulator [Candidatus Longimicrobiales bacterium M2_2A_002]
MSSSSTKSRILTAARTVIVRDGAGGASMREIADGAGVSTAALHYHFGSKEDLADRVLEAVLADLVEKFLNAWSPGETMAANVRHAIRVCSDEFRQDSRVAGYVLAELRLNPARFERVRKRLPTSIPCRLDEVVRHLRASSESSDNIKLCSPPEEFLIDLIGLCAFPFLAGPLLPGLLGLGRDEYESILAERGEAVRDFLLPYTDRQEPTEAPARTGAGAPPGQ